MASQEEIPPVPVGDHWRPRQGHKSTQGESKSVFESESYMGPIGYEILDKAPPRMDPKEGYGVRLGYHGLLCMGDKSAMSGS